MKILVACEESQTVCKAFREKGHEAYSCDILPCSGGHPEWHIQGDAIKEAYSGKYDMMIAHPPCTYLSNAGARFLYPGKKLNEERFKKGLEGKKFFMKLLNAPIEKICVENPVSSKIFELPQYSQEIQPYHFGHPYTKKTRLWLKGLPPLEHTSEVVPESAWISSNTGGKKRGQKYQVVNTLIESTKVSGNWFNKGGTKERQMARSKTFPGIAEAMAEQWG